MLTPLKKKPQKVDPLEQYLWNNPSNFSLLFTIHQIIEGNPFKKWRHRMGDNMLNTQWQMHIVRYGLADRSKTLYSWLLNGIIFLVFDNKTTEIEKFYMNMYRKEFDTFTKCKSYTKSIKNLFFHNGPAICPGFVTIAQGRLLWSEAMLRTITDYYSLPRVNFNWKRTHNRSITKKTHFLMLI